MTKHWSENNTRNRAGDPRIIEEHRPKSVDRDERVSLAPLSPEKALRGLLATKPEKD